MRKFLLHLASGRGILFVSSLSLVQDGGLAFRYMPHLEFTVVLIFTRVH
jgi:hypothetical protein